MTSATHVFALSMGHKNTDRGGAVGEFDWTDDCVDAIRAEIVRRGGSVYVLQEHDNDSNPDLSVNYGLQRVAQIAGQLEAKYGVKFLAYISCHYNGTGSNNSSGFHVVYPDARSGADQGIYNTLDRRLAKRMVDAVRKTNTVGILSWTDVPGVMSERSTRVGSTWYGSAYGRLGELVGTLDIRDHAARLIIEAANISNPVEAAYIRSASWLKNVYAPAIVDALEAEFGTFSTVPVPVPNPEPSPFPAPIMYDELTKYKNVPVEQVPLVVSVPTTNGTEQFVRAYATVTVEDAGVKRLQTLDPDGPVVGVDLNIGESFFVPFVGFNAGRPYTRSFWGTVIYLDGTDLSIPL